MNTMATSKSSKKKSSASVKSTKSGGEVKEQKVEENKGGVSLAEIHFLYIMQLVLLVGVIIIIILGTMIYFTVADTNEKVSKLDDFFELIAPGEYGMSPEEPQPGAPEEDAPEGGDLEVDLEGTRMLGDEDAPVTVVMFSDFRCDFCSQFHTETFDQLKSEYIDSGDVNFVYMDLPVVGGEDAANAAWCAEEQGEFWDFKNGLFELGPQGITDNSMSSLAGDLGMDVDEFEQCYQEERHSDNVMSEAQQGQSVGVTGTPGFIIEGEMLQGAQPFPAFQEAIDPHLS